MIHKTRTVKNIKQSNEPFIYLMRYNVNLYHLDKNYSRILHYLVICLLVEHGFRFKENVLD